MKSASHWRFPSVAVALARATLALLATTAGGVARATAQAPNLAKAIDAYIDPFVATNNFSGQLLVVRGNKVIYERQLGWSDRETKRPMSPESELHIASISTQFTAAAIMRLIDQKKLTLETRVSEIVPEVRGAERMTIRNLLEQRSGISDINSRADYTELLQHHHTPASLVAIVAGDGLRFAPGTQYLHEEHSASNVLALIIERRSGLPFARAMRALVFGPAGMKFTGADDDSVSSHALLARGYDPSAVYAVAPTTPIHWSAKSGNGSIYSTVRDEARWMRALFHGGLLSASSRAAIVDSAGTPFGYGWFRRPNKRFGEFAYSMSGRAPGFASYVIYLPREDLAVIAFSNVYSSATADIGTDIAAMTLGLPVAPIALSIHPIAPDTLGVDGARFTFPADFYQPNATLAFHEIAGEMVLAWPSGDRSPIIPLDRDHAIDRSYWEPISITRDATGRATAITYDRFTGTRAPDAAP